MTDFLYFKLKKNKSKKKAYLGEWTKNFLNKREIKKSIFIKYQSYESYDKQEIKIRYINKLSKKILNKLSKKINYLYNINWNSKSWNYLLAPWLESYVAVVYDRIQMAKALKKNLLIDQDEIYNYGKKISLFSNDYKKFTSNVSETEWNKKLVSKIYFLLNHKELLNSLDIFSQKKIKTYKTLKIKYILFFFKNFILKILERLLCKNNKYLFYLFSYGNIFSFIYLNLKLKQFPFFYAYSFFNEYVESYTPNLEIRKKLYIKLKSSNYEEKIICKLLTEAIPTIFLEGLKKQIKLSENSFLPKNKKMIITKSVLKDNLFRFWTADNISKGSKLILIQHGSGYEYKKCFQNTEYETRVSHKFLSWGWKNKKNTIPLGNIFLSKKKKFKIQKNRNLLIILGLRNIFKLQNMLFSHNDIIEQNNNISYLLSNIDRKYFDKISLKDHPTSMKKKSLKIFNCKNQNFTYEKINENLNKLYDKYSLVITTYDSTEFYNLISRDKPCLQILPKKLIKKKYIKNFNQMYDCGILHNDAISLTRKLKKIYTDPYKWWSNNEIVKKRNNFCKYFSKVGINSSKIINTLNEIEF